MDLATAVDPTRIETEGAPSEPVATDEVNAAVPASSSSSRGIVPIAVAQVDRVVKGVLPPTVRLNREARAAMHRFAHLAVFMLATLAEDSRTATSRTTMTSADVEAALTAAGLAHILPDIATEKKRGRE